jgi:hypothetical protein
VATALIRALPYTPLELRLLVGGELILVVGSPRGRAERLQPRTWPASAETDCKRTDAG